MVEFDLNLDELDAIEENRPGAFIRLNNDFSKSMIGHDGTALRDDTATDVGPVFDAMAPLDFLKGTITWDRDPSRNQDRL